MYNKVYAINSDGTEYDITDHMRLAEEVWEGSFYEKVQLLIKMCKAVDIRFE